MTPARAATLAVAIAASGVLGGCLPSSQRQNDRTISATDSASIALAEQAPVDTLRLVWDASAPETDPMPIPTSLAFVGDGLAVVESQEGSVRQFDRDGTYRGRTTLPTESYPYVAGARGDTLVVLSRGLEQLLWVVPGEGVARSVPVPQGAQQGVATDSMLAVRVGGGIDTTTAPAVVWLDERGGERVRQPLLGPRWRSIGFARARGDSVLALSGYRPVVDVATEAGADTLALVGFSSPQLVRSAQFMRGDVDEPPLLTSSAATLKDRLFVLNLRTDHLRVDVYDPAGDLQRVLVTPLVRAVETVVAMDLAVRERPDGTVEMAVLWTRPPGILQRPESRVALYRWRTPRASASG
ncbi:MAG: hypothetical protein AAGK21_06055 [Bacteroidota bacterium]